MLGKSSENLAVCHATGNSMSPTIEEGQVLLVDVTEVMPQSTKIYLIRIDGFSYIKRLIHVFDKWIIRSDNPDKNNYPDIEINAEKMTDIQIEGRIVWKAGLL